MLHRDKFCEAKKGSLTGCWKQNGKSALFKIWKAIFLAYFGFILRRESINLEFQGDSWEIRFRAVTNAFSWMVGKSFEYFRRKIHANLFNDASFLWCNRCQDESSFRFRHRSEGRQKHWGLSSRMVKLALMVINELLMKKSLITHIIFRLIFFRSRLDERRLF